jgi:hypothetical protein
VTDGGGGGTALPLSAAPAPSLNVATEDGTDMELEEGAVTSPQKASAADGPSEDCGLAAEEEAIAVPLGKRRRRAGKPSRFADFVEPSKK